MDKFNEYLRYKELVFKYMGSLDALWEEYYSEDSHFVDSFNFRTALENVTECVKKQIPRKPASISEVDDNDNAFVECPVCGASNEFAINCINTTHCWRCGQLIGLNWGEE